MRRSAQTSNLFMKSGQVNIDRRYQDFCQEGDINVGYINSRWIRINETSQIVNTKDFPIGPTKKWSVGTYYFFPHIYINILSNLTFYISVSWEWEIIDSFIKQKSLKPFWIDHVDLNNWGKLDPETGRWDGFFGLVGYGAANDNDNDIDKTRLMR